MAAAELRWRMPSIVHSAQIALRRCTIHTPVRIPQTRARFASSRIIHASPLSTPPLLSRLQQARRFHATPSRRIRSDYQRFQQGSTILRRWSQSPSFYYQVGGVGALVGVVYVSNLETVPVSGRRRFNFVTPELELRLSQSMKDKVLSEFGNRVLPPSDPRVRMVQRVLDRLVPNSGLEHQAWEVHVIDYNEPNAFVIPGGKVFVFTGILPICQGEDGLATVLGHEIAHNVAHHSAERMSQAGILWAVALVAFFFLGIGDEGRLFADLVFTRPGSRAQESEADYIGLLMMARSCYDPEAAVGLWHRMQQMEKVKVPQYLSTHPSSHNREDKIREWLPQAEEKRDESGCAMTHDLSDRFRQTIRDSIW